MNKCSKSLLLYIFTEFLITAAKIDFFKLQGKTSKLDAYIGFASTNLNFKSVFVRFVRVVRIPSPRFINFHLSSGGMIADNHFK